MQLTARDTAAIPVGLLAVTSTSTFHCCWKPRMPTATREQLHWDEEQRQQAQQRCVECRLLEAGVVALEPRRAGHGGDHREEHGQRRGDRHAAIPATHEVGHHEVDDRVSEYTKSAP